MNFFIISFLLAFTLNTQAETVEFRIKAGTGEKAWNTPETPIQALVGDEIVFINEDSVPHRLHTLGAPCEHGPEFLPGETWICIAKKTYSAETDGALYDHHFGPDSSVWIEVTEKTIDHK